MTEIIDITGDILHNIKIIGYRTAKDIDVLFPDGTIKTNVRYSHLKANNIKNPNTPNVFNVGFLGIGKYNHKDNLKISQTWMGMLQRCYSDGLHKLRPTYIGCTVHSDWHNYQVFAKWFEENYIEGFQLDKDLTVIGNKEYSAKTCRFIPSDINVILTNVKEKSIKSVSVRKGGRFQSTISLGNKMTYLGLFDSEKEAFYAYKKAKELYLKQQADKYRKYIGEVIYNNLINYTINL